MSAGIFRNYVNYVKVGCSVAKVDTTVFSEDAVKKAIMAIDKRGTFVKREHQYIRIDLVRKLVDIGDNIPELRMPAMLFLASYLSSESAKRSTSHRTLLHGVVRWKGFGTCSK